VLEGGGWSVPRPGRFTPGKDPVPIVKEAGWAPGPVWTCAKNLTLTGIRSADRPARSQSLYRLSYPGPYSFIKIPNIKFHGNSFGGNRADTCRRKDGLAEDTERLPRPSERAYQSFHNSIHTTCKQYKGEFVGVRNIKAYRWGRGTSPLLLNPDNRVR
jgi:hypothetical protein